MLTFSQKFGDEGAYNLVWVWGYVGSQDLVIQWLHEIKFNFYYDKC